MSRLARSRPAADDGSGLVARLLRAWCDHGRRMLEFGLEPF